MFARLGAALALAAFAASASADYSPWFVGATATARHESNLLQLGDGALVPADESRGDTLLTTALQAGFDQHLGRQRAWADLSLRDNRYASNTGFDNLGYTADAGLEWWSALATLGHMRVSNSISDPAVQELDYSRDDASASLQWQPSDLATLAATLSDSQGVYPNYAPGVADRFSQPGLQFSANVQPSGASNLDVALGYSQTRYDVNQARDFSGLTGHIAWTWQPHGHLTLSTRLGRDSGQNSFATTLFGVAGASDYSQLVNSLSGSASYAATAKLSFTASLLIVQRRLVDTILLEGQSLDATGRDHTLTLALGARWNPLRSLGFGCDLSLTQRSASGALTTPLHDQLVSCFGQFQLQR